MEFVPKNSADLDTVLLELHSAFQNKVSRNRKAAVEESRDLEEAIGKQYTKLEKVRQEHADKMPIIPSRWLEWESDMSVMPDTSVRYNS